MDRVRRKIERQLTATYIEAFVRRIVAGGLALVGGLWLVALASPGSVPWLVGGFLALLGLIGLIVGIASQIER